MARWTIEQEYICLYTHMRFSFTAFLLICSHAQDYEDFDGLLKG